MKHIPYILIIAAILSSCSKQHDIEMPTVSEVPVLYELSSTDSNAATLKRTITFLSGWNMAKTDAGVDTVIMQLTDTTVTGNFKINITMPTLKDYAPAHGVCKHYAVPAALGWKSTNRQVSTTSGTISTGNWVRTSWTRTDISRPHRIEFMGVDNWNW